MDAKEVSNTKGLPVYVICLFFKISIGCSFDCFTYSSDISSRGSTPITESVADEAESGMYMQVQVYTWKY